MNFTKLNIFLLVIICAASILITLPTIGRNIDDPNMIVLFSGDEGYSMDLIWSYYSGVRRSSFQMSVDYGLEMIYLSDLARLILSRFIDFTPATFVLILRWVHLISWVGALIALWRLVGYHFGKGWPQILTVLLLWSRPSFDYIVNTLKPEPLVLLFMIIGLDYALRIVENPSIKSLLISIACASIAFIIKFAGIFLLPAVVFAMYFGHEYRTVFSKTYSENRLNIKNSWIFPALISLPLVVSPFLAMFYHVRSTTGLTNYQELGFLGSLSRFKIIFLFWFIAAILILLSFTFFILNKSKKRFLMAIMGRINRINSYSIIVTGIFLGFVLLFGFRWVITPEHFLQTYGKHMVEFAGGFTLQTLHSVIDFFSLLLKNVVFKMICFDIFVVMVFIIYLVIELYIHIKRLEVDKLKRYKRLVLLVYLIPFLLAIFSLGRFSQLHMLPFFVAASILSIQGFYMFNSTYNRRRLFKAVTAALICALFIFDIAINAAETIKLRMRQFRQHEDVVYKIREWWHKNIPPDTKIVADNSTRVYIPSGYPNIKTLRWNEEDRVVRLCQLVDMYRPELVYYREDLNTSEEESMPPIEKILPDRKVKLIKSFKRTSSRYRKKPNVNFVIYEIKY